MCPRAASERGWKGAIYSNQKHKQTGRSKKEMKKKVLKAKKERRKKKKEKKESRGQKGSNKIPQQ